MPKDIDFEGTGIKGFEFEEKGFQERNLQTLLDSLSNKGTQKAISDLSKIEKDEWISMAAVSNDIAAIARAGGLREILGNSIDRIYDAVTDKIDALTSEITNTITGAINELLAPFIADLLIPLINDLTAFLSENQTGAGIGGILGGVVSLWLPGGMAWVAIGAMIGALQEQMMAWSREFLPPEEEVRGTITGYMVWAESHRVGGFRYPSYAEYLAWIESENQKERDKYDEDARRRQEERLAERREEEGGGGHTYQ